MAKKKDDKPRCIFWGNIKPGHCKLLDDANADIDKLKNALCEVIMPEDALTGRTLADVVCAKNRARMLLEELRHKKTGESK